MFLLSRFYLLHFGLSTKSSAPTPWSMCGLSPVLPAPSLHKTSPIVNAVICDIYPDFFHSDYLMTLKLVLCQERSKDLFQIMKENSVLFQPFHHFSTDALTNTHFHEFFECSPVCNCALNIKSKCTSLCEDQFHCIIRNTQNSFSTFKH